MNSRTSDYLRLRRGYAPGLIEKILATTGESVRLLDVATGPGTVIRDLSLRVSEAWGIDTRAELIGEALKLSEPHLHFRCVSLQDFKLETQFDLVTVGQAFELLPEKEHAALSANLRPGGTLAIFWKYPDPKTPASQLFGKFVSPRKDKFEELKDLCIPEALARHRLSLQGEHRFTSEEVYRAPDWVAAALWENDDREKFQDELLKNTPKYVTETYINYLWLFRKD